MKIHAYFPVAALAVALFCFESASADGPAVQWEKTFGGTQTWYALTSEQPAPPEIKFEGDEIIVTLPGFFYSTKTVNDKDYSRIIIPRHGLFLNVGYPELPKVRFNLLIPKDAEAHCELIAVDAMDLELNTPIPSRGSISRDIDPATVPYVEGDFYRGITPFPGEEYRMDSTFVFRGAYGLPIEFYPIQYDPAEDLLRVYKTIRIKWSIDVDAYRAFAFKRTPQEFDEMFKETFANYQSMRVSGSLSEPGRLIIITAGAFEDAVRPLAEWKIQRGLKTEIVKMSEIGTTADAIKSYITTQYQSPESLTYVVLVGDSDTIPTLRGAYEYAACDSCMAMVDGNDPYPDVFISRLSARTVAQVENQVNKFIRYERNPDIDGAWYLRGIGVASDKDGGGPSPRSDWQRAGSDWQRAGTADWQRAEELRAALEGYGFTEVAQIYDPCASKTELIDALNTGASVYNYIGHGSGVSWGTTGFSIEDATALTNGYMNPFIVDVSCLNGSFVNYDACLAESFLQAGTTKAPAGAIAMYSASTKAAWVPPTVMQDAVIKDLLVTNIKHTTGGLYFGGMVAALNVLGTTGYGLQLVEQYNIFGDASLSVRSKKPAVLDVTYPSVLPPTGPVEVEVFTQEPIRKPVFDATVALTYRGAIISVAQTNIEGVATLEYAPIELRNPLLSRDYGLIGDLDGDGAVNFEDLGILTDQWLQPPGVPSADIAPEPMLLTVFAPNTVPVMIKLSDGIVNFVDFSALAEHWLKLPPPDPATNPNPANGATNVNINIVLSWTPGAGATSHDVYFGTESPGTFQRNQTETTFSPGTLLSNKIYYWRIDEVNPYGKTTGDVWSFTTPTWRAWGPNPADGATNQPKSILYWNAGETATAHDVYFGTDRADVENADTFSPLYIDQVVETPGVQPYSTKAVTLQQASKTYYWRIDEVEADGVTIHKGDIWTFSRVGLKAYSPSPADGATNQPKSILYWNAGETANAHDVYFGTDQTAVENADTSSPEYIEQTNQLYSSIVSGLQLPMTTYYWRIDEVVDETTVIKGDIWRFTTAPLKAHTPVPADGTLYVDPNPILTWGAGFNVKTSGHCVYLGTDATAVANATPLTAGIYKGTKSTTAYTTGFLSYDTNYYWRIDEVNWDNTVTKGDVWMFKTLIPIMMAR